MTAPIFDGTDEMTLNRGLGRVITSGKPGGTGNLAIAGHRDSFFRILKDVRRFDVIEINLPRQKDTYSVDSIEIVGPNDMSVLSPTSVPTITLITCYPFYFAGNTPHRFIVKALITQREIVELADGGGNQRHGLISRYEMVQLTCRLFKFCARLSSASVHGMSEPPQMPIEPELFTYTGWSAGLSSLRDVILPKVQPDYIVSLAMFGFAGTAKRIRRFRFTARSQKCTANPPHGVRASLKECATASVKTYGSGYRHTVVLADDHISVVRRVSDLLASKFDVLAVVRNGREAIQAAIEFEPDAFILDICMPGLDGIQAAREIKRLRLSSKFIFLTIQKDTDYVKAARALGASYVLKFRMHEDLVLALNESLDGRIFVSDFSPH